MGVGGLSTCFVGVLDFGSLTGAAFGVMCRFWFYGSWWLINVLYKVRMTDQHHQRLQLNLYIFALVYGNYNWKLHDSGGFVRTRTNFHE